MAVISIGSDHAGFAFKELLVAALQEKGYAVNDVGCYSESSVDYPDMAHPVADAVEKGEAPLGILLCGSANGVAITANKHQGIRAALCWNSDVARLARQHNDANVLCIPARFVSANEALAIMDAFLSATFEDGRHATRVQKIRLSTQP
ncbi:MAG: ribose 5-phosphate isomerase B [Ferruginibacter sp.]